jgi:hypothetical protein
MDKFTDESPLSINLNRKKTLPCLVTQTLLDTRFIILVDVI